MTPEQERELADEQPCDEMPVYEMTGEDVDAFAREQGDA